MKKVRVYIKDYCPFCNMAKNLLKSKGIEYEEVDLSTKPQELMALIKQTGMRTVPQIFFGERFIGGYQELAALDQSEDIVQLANE